MRVILTIPADPSWRPGDELWVYVGTEGAADLASSTPAGGTLKWKGSPFPGALEPDVVESAPFGESPSGEPYEGVGFGLAPSGESESGADVDDVVVEFDYDPTDNCAVLPVGVKLADAAGNVSAVTETTIALRQPPAGPRNVGVASTGSPLEATLSWTLSADVG